MASVQMVVFFVVLLTSPAYTPNYDHHNVTCKRREFQCVTVAQCISSECAGVTDCPDKSDEKGCGSMWWKKGTQVVAGILAVEVAPVVVADNAVEWLQQSNGSSYNAI